MSNINYGWLTGKEAAQIMGISLRSLQRLAQTGQVKRRQEGRSSLYLVEPPTETALENPALEDGDAIDPVSMLSASCWDPAQPLFDPGEVTALIDTLGVKAFLDHVERAKVSSPVTVSRVTELDMNDNNVKILSLSDLHFPFQNSALINRIIDQHADAHVLVLNGDILDAYSASSFSKDRQVLFYEEYMQALDFLIKVSKIFPKIHLVRGNHDQRIDRYVAAKLDPSMHMLGTRDILSLLADGVLLDREGKRLGTYEFKEGQIVYQQNNLPWMTKVGKTIFMHPHSYSGKILSTVEGCLNHLQNFAPWDSFDSVVIGHTHKVGKAVERDKLIIEQGCLTSVMDYQKVGVTVRRPSTLGYAIIAQDPYGNTDFNISSFEFCGTLQYL